MNYIIKELNGKITLIDEDSGVTETIHVIHCSNTIEEIKEESAPPYVVFEYVSNFSRLHLVTAFSHDEALEVVCEFLEEAKEDEEEEFIINGVIEVLI